MTTAKESRAVTTPKQSGDRLRPAASAVRRPARGRAIAAVFIALIALAAVVGGTTTPTEAQAAPWYSSVTLDRGTVQRGQAVAVTATVTSATATRALLDIEIYNGSTQVYQRAWDGRSFRAGVARTFRTSWTVPGNAALGTYVVKVG